MSPGSRVGLMHHPNRVRSQRYFEVDDVGAFVEQTPARQIHIKQRSFSNTNRFVEWFDDGAAFFWYSVESELDGRDCVMAYLPTGDGYESWYVGYKTDAGCRIDVLKGVSREELKSFDGC